MLQLFGEMSGGDVHLSESNALNHFRIILIMLKTRMQISSISKPDSW